MSRLCPLGPTTARPKATSKTGPPPIQFQDGWNIKPDMIVEMPKDFHVAATGTINYQNFLVKGKFPGGYLGRGRRDAPRKSESGAPRPSDRSAARLELMANAASRRSRTRRLRRAWETRRKVPICWASTIPD